jgi:hypothetical protein
VSGDDIVVRLGAILDPEMSPTERTVIREAQAEIERLRAAGDALAEWLLRIVPDQDRDLNDALTEWEARRGDW